METIRAVVARQAPADNFDKPAPRHPVSQDQALIVSNSLLSHVSGHLLYWR